MLFCIFIVNLAYIITVYDFSFETFLPFGYQVLLLGKKKKKTIKIKLKDNILSSYFKIHSYGYLTEKYIYIP